MLGYLKPLYSLSFWFNLTAVPFTVFFDRLMLFGCLALVLGGIAVFAASRLLRGLEKGWREDLRRIAAWAFWFGAVGFVLYGFTWQRVPVLSMRLWLLFWIAPFLWWAVRIVKHLVWEVPRIKEAESERRAYEKWLPKPKAR